MDKNKNLAFKVTVEFTCYNMVDENTLKKEYKNNVWECYKSISDNHMDSASDFADSEKVVKVEIIDNEKKYFIK